MDALLQIPRCPPLLPPASRTHAGPRGTRVTERVRGQLTVLGGRRQWISPQRTASEYLCWLYRLSWRHTFSPRHLHADFQNGVTIWVRFTCVSRTATP